MESAKVGKNPITIRKTIVNNELGMHARPAAKISEIAGTAQSDVWLCVDVTKVDATSIIDILTLGAIKGTQVIIEIQDKADVNILNQILEFFEDGFGEK
ncbi:MAG: HPr family phosphocarrier protein [Desulfobacula sp.]|nr:HPr family phosphocarrier protein [Desulfobacula sp.]